MIRALAFILAAATGKTSPAFTDITWYPITLTDNAGRDVERVLARFDDPEKGVTCYMLSPNGSQWLLSCTKTREAGR